jgi:hypothetical protein
MELAAIGRVANPDELDLSPIVVPVVGYTQDKKEVVFKVQFRKEAIQGMTFDIAASATIDPETQKPTVPNDLALAFLQAHIVNDKEWQKFLRRPDVYIHTDTIVALYETIMGEYAGHPTDKRSASHNGRTTPKATTRAAARSTASTSGRSRSRKG